MDLIFTHIITSVELAFAGAWAGIVHKGIGFAAIAVFIGLAVGSQMLAGIPVFGPFLADFLKPLRKDLLWAAFGVALILGGEYVGDSDAKKHCDAKTLVIEHITEKAVAKTKTPAARAAKDPWDNPQY